MNVGRSGLLILLLLAGGFLAGVNDARESRAQEGKALRNPHGDFDAECSLCHSPESWVPARIGEDFDHGTFGFPLVGAHRETPCVTCHASLDFSQDLSLCVECHQDIHEGELGSDCATCHTTRSFIDRARMEKMHQITRFPLTGVHVTLDCATCHSGSEPGNLIFVNLNSECVGCHRDNYGEAIPDHPGNAFSEDCTLCHRTSAWTPARFGHNDTQFPITGAHRNLDCAACHGEGVFTSVGSACADCHQDDFDGTTDPDHGVIGFSLECRSCHGTTSWRPSTWDHNSFFPIYSGAHNGKWESCSTCHNNPGNYADFTCFACHPHDDQNKTDDDHQGVQQYAYDSLACYTCHPGGRH